MDLISREQALGFLNDLFGEMQTVTFNDVLQSFEKLSSAFEGMTNGEVIQALFPKISVYEHGFTYSVNNEYNFNFTWWNAPYPKGGEE